MTILVTGAAGFIGFHAAQALLGRGEEVIGVDSLNDYYPPRLKMDRLAELERHFPDAFRFMQLDFSDPAALDQATSALSFDRIVHLGAQPGVRYSIENPHAYVQSNIVGHANIVELARRRSIAHVVYASSSSVYGANVELPFRVEDRTDHPVSLYAATKRSCEMISEAYAALHRLPQTGLRFFTVYGPWGRPDMAVWLFTEAILSGRPIRLYNRGEIGRDFTYVDDIVAGLLACLDSPPADDGTEKPGGSLAPHAIFNIGSGRPEPLSRLIETIERACGRTAVRDLLPMQPGDMRQTFADLAAMRERFDYEPATDLETGIPRFVDWYRNYANE